MLSTRAGVARPVRRPRSSSLNTLTAFSMRSSQSRRISSLVMVVPASGVLDSNLLAYQCTDRVASDGPFDVAFALEIENQNGQLRDPAQVDGGSVHHAQIIANHLVVSNLFIAHRMRVLLRAGAVDAIHTCRLEGDVGLQLTGPPSRGRLGGHEP